jgi:hypothetical protein
MIVMNPYYASPSSVGPVFDVANWSASKIVITAVLALTFGLVLAVCGLYFWDPKLFAPYLPKFFKEVTTGILDLHRKYAWSRYAGTFGFAFFAFFSLAGGITCIRDVLSGNFYFRAGPGGMVIRVPDGLDITKFGLKSNIVSFELPWDKIMVWTIVQEKQFGSVSPYAGNLGGYLKLTTFGRQKYMLSLNYFREPPFIIRDRIHEATRMVPLFWEDPPTDGQCLVSNDAT